MNECKNLEVKISHYELEVDASRKRQMDNYEMNITNLERKVADLQRENNYLKEELKLNQDQLSRKSSDIQLNANALRDHELKARQLGEDNNSLTRKINDYEFQMSTLSQEIQRLNTVLKQKM